MTIADKHVQITDEELKLNVIMSINFLASLLKKGWIHIKLVYINRLFTSPSKSREPFAH